MSLAEALIAIGGFFVKRVGVEKAFRPA